MTSGYSRRDRASTTCRHSRDVSSTFALSTDVTRLRRAARSVERHACDRARSPRASTASCCARNCRRPRSRAAHRKYSPPVSSRTTSMSVPDTTLGLQRSRRLRGPARPSRAAGSRTASARAGSASSAVSGRRLESPVSNAGIADGAEQDRVGRARGGERLVGQRRKVRAAAPRRRWAPRGDRIGD